VAPTPLPAAAALPGGARSLECEDLAQLEALLPARLATLPTELGFVLQSGKVADVRVGGARNNCRVVALTYSHPSLPGQVVVRSATPAAYIERYAQNAFVLERGSAMLATFPAMVLTTEGQRCYVTAQGEAVYALEGPASMAELVNGVTGLVRLTGQSEQ